MHRVWRQEDIFFDLPVYNDATLMKSLIYWMAVIYTFMKWGVFWGFVSLVFPIFPLIDIVKWIIKTYPL